MQFPSNIKDETALNWGLIFAVVVSFSIYAIGTFISGFTIAIEPEGNGFFYEWQLANPNFWSTGSAWLLFVAHLLLIWRTIYWAQERSSRKYTNTLKPFNFIALGINAVFILMHYAQTAIFYDGIAQDLPSWTSQGSVIMMLFVIMMMENRRRGMFFGKKLNFRKEFYNWLRDYHGYAFSFAVIYTFWFHPMIPTLGHVIGFVHVIVVMLQGSLMFTRVHTNRKWIFLNEILVLPHAAFVALNQGGGLVHMFFWGFLTIFVVTQMHGLGLKDWMKYTIYALFALSLFAIYTFVRQPYEINEVIRIPLIDYIMIFMTYGLWWLFAYATGKFKDASGGNDTPAIATGD
ncbi:MAG: hypothetical protein Phog2KO_36530 [Phototrophicaceae bacterium]